MMKNIIKATSYVVLGLVGVIASIFGIVSMYFSKGFLPVYIYGQYIIGNQILRWFLYLVLIIATVLTATLAEYGAKFIIKKFRKVKRH